MFGRADRVFSRSGRGPARRARPSAHSRARLSARVRHSALNEGRSVNPGYTRLCFDGVDHATRRSTKAGASTPATRERALPSRTPGRRSTKAGASTPATQAEGRQRDILAARRSTKAGASTPATPRKPCTAVVRAVQRSTKAGASTPATPFVGSDAVGFGAVRSTKAGASTPATRPGLRPTPAGVARPLNEGRSVNPGYTAKFCKRAVSGQTIARPRARGASTTTCLRPFHAISDDTPSEWSGSSSRDCLDRGQAHAVSENH